MPSRPRFRPPAGALLAAAALAVLGGCGQRRTACGDPAPEGGGPPAITSREGELCESVRLRVADALAGVKSLAPETAERWRDLTWRWEDAETMEGLLARVREETDLAIASAMARAVHEVDAYSTKPFRPDCPDRERCLVRGAALGARIAFDDAASILRVLRRGYERTHPEETRPE